MVGNACKNNQSRSLLRQLLPRGTSRYVTAGRKGMTNKKRARGPSLFGTRNGGGQSPAAGGGYKATCPSGSGRTTARERSERRCVRVPQQGGHFACGEITAFSRRVNTVILRAKTKTLHATAVTRQKGKCSFGRGVLRLTISDQRKKGREAPLALYKSAKKYQNQGKKVQT